MPLPSGTKRARLESEDKSDEELKEDMKQELEVDTNREGSVEDDDGKDSVIEGDDKRTIIQVQEDILLQKTVANVNQTVTINKFDNIAVNM